MVVRTTELNDTLAEVSAASDRVEKARRALIGAVARAREAGASYADIGEALGISRQAAWERFAGDIGPGRR